MSCQVFCRFCGKMRDFAKGEVKQVVVVPKKNPLSVQLKQVWRCNDCVELQETKDKLYRVL